MSLALKNMPALFRCADKSSRLHQKQFCWLIASDLFVMLLGASAAIWFEGTDPEMAGRTGAVAAATFGFVASVFLTTYIHCSRLESQWYRARAVAESAKTLAWRYMTCAEPFSAAMPTNQADKEFCERMVSLIQSGIPVGADPDYMTGKQITPHMHEVRSRGVLKRKQAYLEDRLADQLKWYSATAHRCEHRAKVCYLLVVTFQLLAAVTVGFSLWAEHSFDFATMCAALAAIALTWSQIRKYEERGQAYSIAAHELSIAATMGDDVQTESQLSGFVSDAENAISREHTLWIARRDHDAALPEALNRLVKPKDSAKEGVESRMSP